MDSFTLLHCRSFVWSWIPTLENPLKHNNNNCKSVCDIDLAFCCTILVWVVTQGSVLLLQQSNNEKGGEKTKAATETSQKVE